MRNSKGPSSLEVEIVACMPALRAFARRLCRNGIDAEDLVQETLLKALANIEKFEEGTNLRSWMFTIMRNTYCTRIKVRRREVSCGEIHAGSVPAGQEWYVRGRELERALGSLPLGSRTIIQTVVLNGESYETAATRFNCAIGTIKSRLHRARARIVTELGGL